MPEECESFALWFEAWGSRMDFVSGSLGCGCCVNIFDVEGPQEAIDSIPATIRSGSEWSPSSIRLGNAKRQAPNPGDGKTLRGSHE